jgi:DnaJ-class molecular chaperone
MIGVGIFDKRGASPNGQSSGSDGRKRGGTQHTADNPVDQGPLTCPRCQGTGSVERPHVETDEDGTFAGNDVQDCPRCDGKGKVS